MVCRILVFLALFISSSQLPLFAQNRYEEQFRTSKVVVIGKIEKTLWVIDSKKMNEASEDLKKVEEAMLGHLTFMKVEEIIYAEKETKIERTILIYVPKGYWADDSLPRFKTDEKYLIFLSSLQFQPDFEEAVISDFTEKTKETKFDPKIVFFVKNKSQGIIQLTESNKEIINYIRELMQSNGSFDCYK